MVRARLEQETGVERIVDHSAISRESHARIIAVEIFRSPDQSAIRTVNSAATILGQRTLTDNQPLVERLKSINQRVTLRISHGPAIHFKNRCQTRESTCETCLVSYIDLYQRKVLFVGWYTICFTDIDDITPRNTIEAIVA